MDIGILKEDECNFYIRASDMIKENIMWKRKYENVCNCDIEMKNIRYKELYRKNAIFIFEHIVKEYVNRLKSHHPWGYRENNLLRLLDYIYKNMEIFDKFKEKNTCLVVRYRVYEMKIHMIKTNNTEGIQRIDTMYPLVFGGEEQLDINLCRFIQKYLPYLKDIYFDTICENVHKFMSSYEPEAFSYEDIFE